MILTQNLKRAFATRTVLNGVNFKAEPGERVAILGANGSGKTTFLRVLATLLAPTSGDVWLLGKKLGRGLPDLRRHIGWAPASDGGFLPRFTGEENLNYWGALYRLSEGEVLSSVRSWKNLPSLESGLKTPFQEQSLGMQQSLNLVRAFLKNPSLILLDEPTRGLDRQTAETFSASLLERTRDKVLVFTSHSSENTDRLATRKVRLEGGRFHD